MASQKLSRELTEAIEDSNAEGPVDVILELDPPTPAAAAGAGRAQQIAARKDAFSKHAESVAGQIRRLGGEVTGQAWINSTMRARISKQMLSALSEVPQIKRLDVPRAVQPDSSE